MRRRGPTPNPALVSFLGLCPLVGTTGNLASGFTLALVTGLVVLAMDLFGRRAALRLPQRLLAVSQLAFASFCALLAGLAIELYSPAISIDLGFYVPLILVNCLLLHQVRKVLVPPGSSRPSPVGPVLGYLGVAIAVSAIREFAGSGSLTLPTPGVEPLAFRFFSAAPLPLLLSPAGGFIVLAGMSYLVRLSKPHIPTEKP